MTFFEDQEEDDDAPDQELRSQLHVTFPVSTFEKLLDELGVTDSFVRHTVLLAKELEYVSGDADPIVAHNAREITDNLIAIFADYKRSPGKAVISVIKAMENPAEQQRAIAETRQWLDLLQQSLGLDAQ